MFIHLNLQEVIILAALRENRNNETPHCTVFSFSILHISKSQDSSVNIVSGYGQDDRAIKVRSLADAKGIFPPASVSRLALGSPPPQPPVKWALGVLSPGVKAWM
jgi:hypothetical protein